MASRISNRIDVQLSNFGVELATWARKALLRTGAFPPEKDMNDALAYAKTKAANAIVDFLEARETARCGGAKPWPDWPEPHAAGMPREPKAAATTQESQPRRA